jgi:hypothetical protein
MLNIAKRNLGEKELSTLLVPEQSTWSYVLLWTDLFTPQVNVYLHRAYLPEYVYGVARIFEIFQTTV